MVDIRLIRKHIRRLVEHTPGGKGHNQKNHAGDEEVYPEYDGWTKAELENRIRIIKERGSKKDQKEIPLIQAAIKKL